MIVGVLKQSIVRWNTFTTIKLVMLILFDINHYHFQEKLFTFGQSFIFFSHLFTIHFLPKVVGTYFTMNSIYFLNCYVESPIFYCWQKIDYALMIDRQDQWLINQTYWEQFPALENYLKAKVFAQCKVDIVFLCIHKAGDESVFVFRVLQRSLHWHCNTT